jgi:hypothetical protein
MQRSSYYQPLVDLLHNVKVKYGILDEDTYNFYETSFAMGIVGTFNLVTASQRRTRPLGIQPSDHKW